MAKKTQPHQNHWFYKMSKAAQANYIKAHPNSIYAKKPKEAKVKAGIKSVIPDIKKKQQDAVNRALEFHRQRAAAKKTVSKK